MSTDKPHLRRHTGSNEPEPLSLEVHILHISHNHGDSFWLHLTEEACREDLANFARDWWHHEGLPSDPPEDTEEAVAAYFDSVADHESYVIASARLTVDSGHLAATPELVNLLLSIAKTWKSYFRRTEREEYTDVGDVWQLVDIQQKRVVNMLEKHQLDDQPKRYLLG